MPADNGGVGADGSPPADDGFFVIFMALGVLGPGGQIVGKYTGGTAEHIVLNLHALIDRHIVLNFYAVADLHVVGDVHVLSQGAILSNPCPLLDVAEIPDLGTLADLHILVHIAAFMYEGAHLSNLPAKSVEATFFSGSLTGFPVAADW